MFSLSWGGYTLTEINAQEMTTYTVKGGSHFSFPRVLKLKRNVKTVEWEVVFHDNCRYEIKGEDGLTSNDQADWNKLCGAFFSLFNTRKDAAMIGWRYNIVTQQIELAPYYHVDGSRDMFPPMVYT